MVGLARRLPLTGRASVEAFRKNNEKQVLFFAYIQWLINSQMAEVSDVA